MNGMMKMISVAGSVVGGNDGLQLSIANCLFAHLPTFENCNGTFGILAKTKSN